MSLTITDSGVEYDEYCFENSGSGVCEIEEEINSTELFEIKEEFEGSLFSVDFHGRDHQDSVYVAVGKSESSMYALSWTLQHLVNPSTIIYLIHVFPEIKHIPSPCKLSTIMFLSLSLSLLVYLIW